MPAPEVLLATVSAHWAIENTLHSQHDVIFRQDAAQNRSDNDPGNIAILRRPDLNLIRSDTLEGSLSTKLKRAAGMAIFSRAFPMA